MKATAIIASIAFVLMSFTAIPDTAAITWKSEVLDLGTIPQGTPKSVTFEFKNTGTETVIITNVKASCGCTTADYTKTPVKPGGNASVTAVYNAAAAGAFSKTVSVTTNADATPKVLTFKGVVK